MLKIGYRRFVQDILFVDSKKRTPHGRKLYRLTITRIPLPISKLLKEAVLHDSADGHPNCAMA